MTLDMFAPYTAEDMWALLGYEGSVGLVPWRHAEPTLLVEDTVTAVVQVNGKVRATIEVAARVSAEELEALALGDERIVRQLEGQQVMKVIVRAPKVVSIAVKPLG